jgi:hypothetical protein
MAPKTENGRQKISTGKLLESIWKPKPSTKTYQKLHDFLVTILMDLYSVLNLILQPFVPQHRDRKQKRENIKIELSCTRELNFQGFGPSQTINKPIKNAS